MKAVGKFLRSTSSLLERNFFTNPYVMAVEENTILNLLMEGLKAVSEIEIEDISAGCGTMFRVAVVSADFEGVSKIQQHKMIHKILKEEIPKLHGITIETRVPSNNEEGPEDDDL